MNINNKYYYTILYIYSLRNCDDVHNGDVEDGGDESGAHASRSLPKPKIAAAQAAAVTNVVAGRVGNLLGKGIGGLSSKLGTGGWF